MNENDDNENLIITDLAPDILLEICSHLNFDDFIRFAATNNEIRNILFSSEILRVQYRRSISHELPPEQYDLLQLLFHTYRLYLNPRFFKTDTGGESSQQASPMPFTLLSRLAKETVPVHKLAGMLVSAGALTSFKTLLNNPTENFEFTSAQKNVVADAVIARNLGVIHSIVMEVKKNIYSFEQNALVTLRVHSELCRVLLESLKIDVSTEAILHREAKFILPFFQEYVDPLLSTLSNYLINLGDRQPYIDEETHYLKLKNDILFNLSEYLLPEHHKECATYISKSCGVLHVAYLQKLRHSGNYEEYQRLFPLNRIPVTYARTFTRFDAVTSTQELYRALEKKDFKGSLFLLKNMKAQGGLSHAHVLLRYLDDQWSLDENFSPDPVLQEISGFLLKSAEEVRRKPLTGFHSRDISKFRSTLLLDVYLDIEHKLTKDGQIVPPTERPYQNKVKLIGFILETIEISHKNYHRTLQAIVYLSNLKDDNRKNNLLDFARMLLNKFSYDRNEDVFMSDAESSTEGESIIKACEEALETLCCPNISRNTLYSTGLSLTRSH